MGIGTHKKTCLCCICKAKRGEGKGENNPFFGRKHSLKTRKLMKLNHSDMRGEKNPFYGKIHTEHAKILNSIRHVGVFLHKKSCRCPFCKDKTGKNNPFYGKQHTDFSRMLISLAGGGTGIPFEKIEYGPEFTKNLKEKIRCRDKYLCGICGVSQKNNGKLLDIHHVDYNKKNNENWNLISLCVKCHRKTNFNRVYWENRLRRFKYL